MADLYPCVEKYMQILCKEIQEWHQIHQKQFNKAKGSSSNHQAWEGGYRDHITQCFIVADRLYSDLEDVWGKGCLKFPFESVLKVLYFHDVEKLFKYTTGIELPNKYNYLFYDLLVRHNIRFTEEEVNALLYIHGEGDNYRKDKRVMNELAGFCHAVDVLSARVLHDKGTPI